MGTLGGLPRATRCVNLSILGVSCGAARGSFPLPDADSKIAVENC
jgi:hypothetical protein